MLIVESDNALGSQAGDVDDGFALATLFLKKIPFSLASTYGNTSEENAFAGNRALAELFDWKGTLLRGPKGPKDVSPWARSALPVKRIVCLGPLTSLGQITDSVSEVVILGSNLTSRGIIPPVWPFEFNFTKDRDATVRTFASDLPLTVLPLDVCGRMRVRWSQVEALRGDVGAFLKKHAKRWWNRSLWMKGRSVVPVWDLVAALYLIEPSLFQVETHLAAATPWQGVRYGVGRPIKVVTSFSPIRAWDYFAALG